ncbi:hypothetical protein K2173_006124 [Erythroxylum novogranatense]|uniref:AB hydrolase-1 domain-containing protein n=1 Tax=Erythroxylum novogranatense TaxID=1862640 RepID=A0AAV8TEH2_9ROSI|nr:hypothetical protein K2173_006124 [Erythroxylum novogranatense]
MAERQRHFVLVHGAWCWYKVAALLKSAGHKVTALDLAASGIHFKQPLTNFLMSLPSEERVIVVGHSMGGLGSSVAVERFPEKISVVVFATAVMPGPDFSYTAISEEFHSTVDSFMDSHYRYDDGPNSPPSSVLFGPNFLATKFYQLSPPEQKLKQCLPRRNSVPRVYILCGQDKIINEDLQKWMIQNNPVDEVEVISGSDHMVMFSKPEELCLCLLRIAKRYF